MLLTLLVFHTYRWKLIFAMILRQMSDKGQVGEDIRSGPELFLCGYFLCFASHDTTTCRQCLSKLLISIFPDHRFWRWRLNANCPDFALGAVNSWRKQLGWVTERSFYSSASLFRDLYRMRERKQDTETEYRWQRRFCLFFSLSKATISFSLSRERSLCTTGWFLQRHRVRKLVSHDFEGIYNAGNHSRKQSCGKKILLVEVGSVFWLEIVMCSCHIFNSINCF